MVSLNRKKGIERTHKVKDYDSAISYLSKMLDKFKNKPKLKKALEIEYCFLQLKKHTENIKF